MSKKSPISKRLKEARLATGISQKQLGIAIGIDEFVASARMNQYETGKHEPNFIIVKKIAKQLNVPAAFFYASDDDLACLLKMYYQLPNKQKQCVMKFIENLTE
jgi:transcriptional regulator with XRE-family HTH domain